MSIPHVLVKLVGEWTGTNQLWLMPGDPGRECATTVTVAPAANGQFLSIRYTWDYEGLPQEGLILVGSRRSADEITPDSVQAVWIDSWHMQDQFMICQGIVLNHEGVRLGGTYAAPPDPDWGWWITLEAHKQDSWRLIMHNVPPGKEAVRAVEAVFHRER